MPIDEPTEEEIYASKLNAELTKWQHLGITPDGWMPSGGILMLLVRFDVLNDILVEAGILDMDDASERMRVKMLERLKGIREELEPQLRAAKIAEIRANGGIINVPPGFKS